MQASLLLTFVMEQDRVLCVSGLYVSYLVDVHDCSFHNHVVELCAGCAEAH